MEKINFSDCTLAKLEKKIGLYWVSKADAPKLMEWTNTAIVLDDFELQSVQRLSSQLERNAFHWKEYDLSLHFIGPMFSIVDFTELRRFNLFAQRDFEAVVQDNLTLLGKVDEVVATGFREPEIPFFAFTEYKKETDPNGDPNGQCLSAMLVGQTLNQDKKSLMYGCVVVGRNWRFLLLEGKKYAISDDYNATNLEEAYQILRILKQLKAYCMLETKDYIVKD